MGGLATGRFSHRNLRATSGVGSNLREGLDAR
jgi:hypothetical protein